MLCSHRQAVAIVLAIIAVKMSAETIGITLLTPLQSLLVVLATLGGGVAASLLNAKSPDEGDTPQ